MHIWNFKIIFEGPFVWQSDGEEEMNKNNVKSKGGGKVTRLLF